MLPFPKCLQVMPSLTFLQISYKKVSQPLMSHNGLPPTSNCRSSRQFQREVGSSVSPDHGHCWGVDNQDLTSPIQKSSNQIMWNHVKSRQIIKCKLIRLKDNLDRSCIEDLKDLQLGQHLHLNDYTRLSSVNTAQVYPTSTSKESLLDSIEPGEPKNRSCTFCQFLIQQV